MRNSIIGITTLLIMSGQAIAAIVPVGVQTDESELFTISTSTGAATSIEPVRFRSTGLAWDASEEVVYGWKSQISPTVSALNSIDRATGIGIIIRTASGDNIADISIDTTGNLFGIGRDGFFSINKTTGSTTFISSEPATGKYMLAFR